MGGKITPVKDARGVCADNGRKDDNVRMNLQSKRSLFSFNLVLALKLLLEVTILLNYGVVWFGVKRSSKKRDTRFSDFYGEELAIARTNLPKPLSY